MLRGMKRQYSNGRKKETSSSLVTLYLKKRVRLALAGKLFAELDRVLAADAGFRFIRGDIAHGAVIIQIVQLVVAPGLVLDDFDKRGLREAPSRDLQFAFTIARIQQTSFIEVIKYQSWRDNKLTGT